MEIQLCRRSALGMVVPIARSDDPELVRLVARRIVDGMQRLRFTDPTLNEVAEVERVKLRQHLAMEGVNDV